MKSGTTKPVIGTDISISDFQTVSLAPNVNPKYKHLAPTITGSECSFTLHGVDNAFANAIRRVISAELSVRYLHCEYEDLITDDPFVIPEMITKRLKQIPLMQTANGTYALHVENNSLETLDVKTKDLRGSLGAINQNITIVTLQPGCKISFRCTIASARGYEIGSGMCAVAVNCVSLAKDIEPFNLYTEKGVKSQMCDPRVWEIRFKTNGTEKPSHIVQRACDDIVERLNRLTGLLYTIQENEEEYHIRVQNESDTIGNLIMKSVCDQYPDVDSITYTVPTVERSLLIKIKYADDVVAMLKNVINHLVKTYSALRSSLN